MTDTRRPNEISQNKKTASAAKGDLPNAIDGTSIPLWLRKKRHMSGLMCPQPGYFPSKEMLAKLEGK